jgi:TolA-binding protein
MKFFGSFLLVLALVAAADRPSFAQAAVTTSDIQRLQDNAYDASREISQLRSRDAGLAGQLQSELDDARDEIVYLRVKLRKKEQVTRSDYSDLRDRLEALRTRAITGDAPRTASTAPAPIPVPAPAPPPPPVSTPAPVPAPAPASTPRPARQEAAAAATSMDVPVGTNFDVVLQNSLSSGSAQVEDRFEATTATDLKQGDRVVVPAGSAIRGIVSSVTKAGRIERTGKMTVAFDQITVQGRAYPIRATVTQAIESEGVKGEAGKIGAGAGVGAILGAILGGGKGALAGVLIGGGGTMAATEGKDVELPAGATLRVRLDSGLNVR